MASPSKPRWHTRRREGTLPAPPAARERRGRESAPKVPLRHLVASTRQLATLVKAGVPILQSVRVLGEQTEHAGFRRVLQKVEKDVEGGASLSDAIGRFPSVFPEIYTRSLAAAETGGVMDVVLLRLAVMLERDQEISSMIKGALRYPLIVVVVLVGAVVILMVAVVPKFAGIYAQFHTTLPLPTRLLILGSRIFREGWMFVIPGIAAVFYAFRTWIRTRAGRYLWDTWKLRVPVFGPLLMKVAMGRFASLLALMYANGVPMLKALEVISRAVGNSAVGREVGVLLQAVQAGQGLSGGMKRARFFTPLIRHMTAVGETSGALQEVLESVVAYYELEVRVAVANLTALIEPMLTVGLGVIILFLALAIYLPLWNLMSLFRK